MKLPHIATVIAVILGSVLFSTPALATQAEDDAGPDIRAQVLTCASLTISAGITEVFVPVDRKELLELGVSDLEAFDKNARRDPSGMVWLDTLVKPDGSPRFMTQKDAEDYCRSIGAKLPSGWPESENPQHLNGDSDFVRLAKYMGWGTTQRYTPRGLPNVTSIEGERIVSNYFRSSSVTPNPDYNYSFTGSNGTIGTFHRNEFWFTSVRCVVRPAPARAATAKMNAR